MKKIVIWLPEYCNKVPQAKVLEVAEVQIVCAGAPSLDEVVAVETELKVAGKGEVPRLRAHVDHRCRLERGLV